MSIYSYRIFDEIVKTGSFVKASENMNLSASAVSHMIKNLEDEFGFPLFLRNRKGAVLTDDGKKLVPYINTLLNTEDSIRQVVNMINSHEVGTVRIGLFSSVASNWFVKILSNFKERYPEVDVVLYQGSYSDILKWIDEKVIDIAFTTDKMASDLNFIPLRTDSLICVTPEEYVPRNKFSISIEDLRNEDVIINSECEAYDARDFLKANKIAVKTHYDVMEHQTLFAMVKEGMGICIVPELVASNTPQNVKKYPIIGNPSRTIGLTITNPNFISPVSELMKNEIIEFTKNI